MKKRHLSTLEWWSLNIVIFLVGVISLIKTADLGWHPAYSALLFLAIPGIISIPVSLLGWRPPEKPMDGGRKLMSIFIYCIFLYCIGSFFGCILILGTTLMTALFTPMTLQEVSKLMSPGWYLAFLVPIVLPVNHLWKILKGEKV